MLLGVATIFALAAASLLYALLARWRRERSLAARITYLRGHPAPVEIGLLAADTPARHPAPQSLNARALVARLAG